VPRRKGYANPITVFTNIDKIIGYLQRHIARQGPKTEPNQCDPLAWVYDIGENGDCSIDALVSDNVADLIAAFRGAGASRVPRHPLPPSTSTGSCSTSIRGAAPESGSRLRQRRIPACSTSAPARSPTGSPPSTTSSPPVTRCT
jgi:hypothetical protein